MRSGCVDIHLKGNTEGGIQEGFCSVSSLVSCFIWRQERRMDEWVMSGDKEDGRVVVKYMGLGEDEK